MAYFSKYSLRKQIKQKARWGINVMKNHRMPIEEVERGPRVMNRRTSQSRNEITEHVQERTETSRHVFWDGKCIHINHIPSDNFKHSY